MPTGVPFNPDEEEFKSSIIKHYGRLSNVAKDFFQHVFTIRQHVKLLNLQDLVDEAQEAEEHMVDDLSISAVDKLLQKLDDEPSVALNAAIKTLTRTRGTRKRWVANNTESTTLLAKEETKELDDRASKHYDSKAKQ